FLDIENVLGCECRTDTVEVLNHTASAFNITSDALNDPSGKYTMLDHIPTGNFNPGQSFTYHVNYCPNDVTQDRADRSYIQINIGGGAAENYQILLQGSSMTPKLAVTPLTTYGPVEVGWQKDDSITIENNSITPVHVTSVAPPPGYTLTSVSPPLPFWLSPRDSIT